VVHITADSVTKILDRFGDAGFTSNEVVALLVSYVITRCRANYAMNGLKYSPRHSVAAADHVDPTVSWES